MQTRSDRQGRVGLGRGPAGEHRLTPFLPRPRQQPIQPGGGKTRVPARPPTPPPGFTCQGSWPRPPPPPVLPLLPPGASPPSPSWGPPPAPTQQAAGRHQHEGAGSPPRLWGGPGKPSSPGAAEVRGPWPQEPRALESRDGRDHRPSPRRSITPSPAGARPGGAGLGAGGGDRDPGSERPTPDIRLQDASPLP